MLVDSNILNAHSLNRIKIMSKLYKGIRSNNRFTVRNADDSVLTEEQLRTAVPSIFESTKHEDRSNRFMPVCTWDSLQELRTEGYEPFFATQTAVRDESKINHTRHMIRLRDVRTGLVAGKKESANEIIILNANDGTSAFHIIAGQFRFVCANGLVMGNIEKQNKVYHKGTAQGNVFEGVYEVLEDFKQIEYTQNRMQSLMLTDKTRSDLAHAAYWLMNPFDVEEVQNNGWKLPEYEYDPMSLLMPRRADDNKKDMYSTFNVLQENVIKGGVKRFQGRATRGITNINKDISTNTLLWNLAVTTMKDVTPIEY